MANVMGQVLTLLSDNWTPGNTETLTPIFFRITDQKKYDYNSGQDVIYTHRNFPSSEPAGIGDTQKRKRAQFNLDIRVYGKDNEDHFDLVYDEVIRIIEANIVNPFTGWQEIRTDGNLHQDLSDRTKGQWRIIVPLRLVKFNVARGSSNITS